MDEKSVNIRRVPAELWQRLKIQAAKENSTLQELLVRAVERYLDQAA